MAIEPVEIRITQLTDGIAQNAYADAVAAYMAAYPTVTTPVLFDVYRDGNDLVFVFAYEH